MHTPVAATVRHVCSCDLVVVDKLTKMVQLGSAQLSGHAYVCSCTGTLMACRVHAANPFPKLHASRGSNCVFAGPHEA